MMRRMRSLLIGFVFSVMPLAWAAETLPDSAPPDSEAPQTRESTSATPLDGDEMDSLYLASPVELDTTDESQGLNAVSNDDRFYEEQQELRERTSVSVTRSQTPEAPPARPPTLIPIRDM